MKRILIALSVILSLLSGCTEQDHKTALEKAIVGEWVDSQGFTIQFSANGEGFIPGVEGKIPDSKFSYTVTDDTHISIDLGGQSFTLEILIEGDNLTWKDQLGEVEYTRKK